MFYTMLEQVVTTKHKNQNCIKQSAKLPVKNVTQMKKNLSCGKE